MVFHVQFPISSINKIICIILKYWTCIRLMLYVHSHLRNILIYTNHFNVCITSHSFVQFKSFNLFRRIYLRLRNTCSKKPTERDDSIIIQQSPDPQCSADFLTCFVNIWARGGDRWRSFWINDRCGYWWLIWEMFTYPLTRLFIYYIKLWNVFLFKRCNSV